MPPKGYRRRFCKRGHDRFEVGTVSGMCSVCYREAQRRSYYRNKASGEPHVPTKRFCPRGHDKLEVGLKGRGCAACVTDNARLRAREKKAEKYETPVELFGRRDAPLESLQGLREMFGLSRARLAFLAGIHAATVRKLETGESRGYPTTRAAIMNALAPCLADLRDRRDKAGLS